MYMRWPKGIDRIENGIEGECEKCGKIKKFKKEQIKEFPKGYKLKKPYKCECGMVSDFMAEKVRIASGPKCPRCRSTDITANKKGFGLGKALGGAILTGGIGLAAGFIGSGKIKMTCLSCGHEWKPG